LAGEFAHQVIDHAVQYVDGRVHTNGLENFWSLLKRGINGTYVSVEPFHCSAILSHAHRGRPEVAGNQSSEEPKSSHWY
jgi:hypothetical protein